MLRHVILGLLRDGCPRHGYGLLLDYHGRCGERLNVGNIYRELARLAAQGLIRNGLEPPEEDARRILYRITPAGCREFDHWLRSPLLHDDEVCLRLAFIEHIPDEALTGLLERWRDTLWARGKNLASAREDALRRRDERGTNDRYDALPALLARQLKHVMAELEFLAELWADLERARGLADR